MYTSPKAVNVKSWLEDHCDIFTHVRSFLTIDDRIRIGDIQKLKLPAQLPTANVGVTVKYDEEVDDIHSNVITKKVLWVLRFENDTQMIFKLVRQQGRSDGVYFLSYLILNKKEYFDSFVKLDVESPERSGYFRLGHSLFNNIFPPI